MSKKVLVIGSGGREHALCEALAASAQVAEVFCAPGNGGIGAVATCVPDLLLTDHERLAQFALEKRIDLTVVGPEGPLVGGIVDVFRGHGLVIFGPDKAGAQLEGSKVFAKRLMARHNVPTAGYFEFTDLEAARAHIAQQEWWPIVVKVDGLAAGKGVTVCLGPREAVAAIDEAMETKRFGDAGSRVIVEEFLRGEEASVHAITDGDTLLMLPTAQDHKAIFDGDKGPNTGGMGAYSPAPVVEGEMLARVERTILVPMLDALKHEGITYRGVLFAGLMITRGGPRVIEFNARFGDPETEVMLPRLRGDFYEMLYAAATGRLADLASGPDVDPRPCVGVVMAAEGYPGNYAVGKPIYGLEDAEALADVRVYHAGTRQRDDGGVSTAGGRVLCVSALGASFQAARDRAYTATAHIRWEGAYKRTDIAHRAIGREATA
ncbi:MAG: phosphoribosylamine--glycine ligase [Planctomycetota bacterium]|nr:phosphoribosylamine--glycine ligase [Planctomycetota bacterium]